RRLLRPRRHLLPRQLLAVGRRDRRRRVHHRVLEARLAVRPAHRRSAHAAGHPAGADVRRGRRGRRPAGGDLMSSTTRTVSELRIDDLHVSVHGREILKGVDLVVRSGEVHAVMGPNGAGKSTLSHVIMGKGGYEVTGGSVTLDGVDLLSLPTWKRARAGLFLAMQYPTEVPGVSLEDAMRAALVGTEREGAGVREALLAEAERIGFDARFLDRPLNVDLSGGEKKRNETLQLGVLRPKIAVLDELDSGLDVDALRM